MGWHVHSVQSSCGVLMSVDLFWSEDSISLPRHPVHCQLTRKSHVNSFSLVLKIRVSGACKCKILSCFFFFPLLGPQLPHHELSQSDSKEHYSWKTGYIWWIFWALVYRFRRVQILCVWARYEQHRQQLRKQSLPCTKRHVMLTQW